MARSSDGDRSAEEIEDSDEHRTDVIIIGTGPAGLTAGVYAGKHGLETTLFEKESIGGELVNRHDIRGYPGFPTGVSGTDLRSDLTTALDQYDSQVLLTEVEGITPGQPHLVQTNTGRYRGDVVVLATGGRPKPLNIPGEEQFQGRGIFHCAKCDGPLYRDEAIAVIGGNDHAVIDSLHLSNFASEVLVISPDSRLTANENLRIEAASKPNITIKTNTEIMSVSGNENVLDSVTLRETSTDSEWDERVDGLYAHTGIEPNTEFVKGTVPLNNDGFVKVDEKMESEVDGIFAVGDIRRHSAQEVASAVGDGAVAIEAAKEFIR